MTKTRDFTEVIRRQLASDPVLAEMVEEEAINARIATLIYEARTEEGLTQQELASRIGSHQPVIARLEDADYDGHSLTMLKKIARATGRRLNIDLYCVEEPKMNTQLQLTADWSQSDEWQPSVETTFEKQTTGV
jgi:transcriptional regulator with XRE-family HTH domain